MSDTRCSDKRPSKLPGEGDLMDSYLAELFSFIYNTADGQGSIYVTLFLGGLCLCRSIDPLGGIFATLRHSASIYVLNAVSRYGSAAGVEVSGVVLLFILWGACLCPLLAYRVFLLSFCFC